MGRLYRPSSEGVEGQDVFPDKVGRPTDLSDSTSGRPEEDTASEPVLVTDRNVGYGETAEPETVALAGAGAAPGAYDPAEHSVDEVNDYLAEHPEDAAAVLEAEASEDGKQRKGVLEGPHAANA